MTADQVFALTADLRQRGVVRRLGPVIDARSLGYVYTLLALEVDPEKLDAVASAADSFPEVTHNYQRDHQLNVWSVVVAADRDRLAEVVRRLGELAGVRRVLDLPVRRRYKLDLRFPLDGAQENARVG